MGARAVFWWEKPQEQEKILGHISQKCLCLEVYVQYVSERIVGFKMSLVAKYLKL